MLLKKLHIFTKIYIFSFIVLIGCSGQLEENAKKAFSEEKYQKAFVLYKEAIVKKPTKQVLYDGLLKSVGAILHQGLIAIKDKEYQKAIEILSTIATDEKYATTDAKTATGVAYINGYLESQRNIRQGLFYLMEALLQAQQKIPTRLTPSLLKWLVKQGFDKKDILTATLGNRYDIGAVYRSKLFYDIAHNSMSMNNFLPIPEALSELEQEAFAKVHSLFTWCIHNIQSISSEHPQYFPASIANIFVRGYGTTEDQSLAFLFLCQQIGIPGYLLETEEKTNYVLLKIKNNWLFFDFKNQKLVQKDGKLSFSLKENLKRVGCEEKGNIWLAFPARNIIPRMSLIPKCYLSLHIDSPHFFYNTWTMASIIYKDLGKKIKGTKELLQAKKSLSVSLYPKQIQTWKIYNSDDNDTLKEWQKKDTLDASVRKISIFALARAKEKTTKSIEEVSKDSNDFLDYHRARALLLLDDKANAEKAFIGYLEKYPQGFWRTSCHMQLGYIYASTDVVKSKNHYEKASAQNVIEWSIK